MKKQYTKIALAVSVMLAMVLTFSAPAMAQCGGKTVYIQLPATWGSTTYIRWEGSFVSITGTKNGAWTEFTLPNLPNDSPNKREIIFLDQNQYFVESGINYVAATVIGTSTMLPEAAQSDVFTCSQFGDDGTWIMEDLLNPGITVVSTQPPTDAIYSNAANANKMQLIKNGVLLHSTKDTYLEIFSLNGKLLRKMNFASGIYSVELSDLPKGLYIAKVRFGNSNIKVLKISVM